MDTTELRRASQVIAADYTAEAFIVWNAADHIDGLTTEIKNLRTALAKEMYDRMNGTIKPRATPTRNCQSGAAERMAHDAIDALPQRTMADLYSHPNDIGARGAIYCPHCGAPDTEHSNGVCMRFPAMQPPLA